MIKTLSEMQELQETRVQSLGSEDPLEEGVAPTAFLLGECHGQRITVHSVTKS